MPVFNSQGELIAVTQLVNKRQRGDFPEYDPADWPRAPDVFRASFTKRDEEFMRVFNIQAGVALENAMLFAKVREQQQIQEDILRSLSDSVISIDKHGNIVGLNERARELLGCSAENHSAGVEGRSIFELVKTAPDHFSQWIDSSINGQDRKTASQYYPEQTVGGINGEQRTVNISINRMADVENPQQARGALIVMEDVSHEKRLKSTLYRYMTQELAEQLLQDGDARMGGERKTVSVLFSDIRNYTGMTEKMEAEEVVQFLNGYFETMVDAVFRYKGTLDKYIGDAIMAVFGAPLRLEDHAWMAVQSALDMRERLAEFNVRRSADFRRKFPAAAAPLPIRIGIGINSDTVISGNIGCTKRMEFTAIGDGVNLSSRLESASKAYGCDILLSQSTYRECAGRILARELDVVRVKGKTEPIAVYELIGRSSDRLSDDKARILEYYAAGRELFLRRRFAEARRQFERVLDIDSTDKSSIQLARRCDDFSLHPPSDDWDGSWTMLEK
jgi:adenylate cyclase